MGGKSSKQKVKISKPDGGKQGHGKGKEQKERVENGEAATVKFAQNEVTENESEDNAADKAIAKSENAVTDLDEKRADDENQKELTQSETVKDSIQHPSEATSANIHPSPKQVSHDENKIEISKEEPVKEQKAELGKEEMIEKLEESAVQEELCLKPAEIDTASEAQSSNAHTEQVQDECDKTGEEGDNIPAILLDTSIIGAVTSTEAYEANGLIETTKCEEDGLEQNVLLMNQAS